jgi:hypothetical protein
MIERLLSKTYLKEFMQMVLKTEEVIYRNAKIDLLQDPIPQSSEFLLFLEIIFFSYLQSSLLVCNFGKP